MTPNDFKKESAVLNYGTCRYDWETQTEKYETMKQGTFASTTQGTQYRNNVGSTTFDTNWDNARD